MKVKVRRFLLCGSGTLASGRIWTSLSIPLLQKKTGSKKMIFDGEISILLLGLPQKWDFY